MKRAFLAFLLGSAVTAQAQFATNLVKNGSAETFAGPDDGIVDFADWTRTGNVYVNRYTTFPLVYEGTSPTGEGAHYFLGGSPPAGPQGVTTSLTQTVDLAFATAAIDAGTAAFDLSAWFNVRSQNPTGPDDGALLRVEFLGVGGAPLGTSTLGEFTGDRYASNPALQNVSVGFFASLAGTVPTGARTGVVTQLYTRRSGTVLNSGMDLVDLKVRAVPEPASLAALSLGALVLLRRRKAA